MAAAQPAVFQTSGQGIVTDASRNLIGPGNPAQTGEAIVIYCAGFGAVNPAIPDGFTAPNAPLSRTVSPVTVTIGGQDAVVSFSGSTPGFADYTKSMQPCKGVLDRSGNQIPASISVQGQTSASVFLSAQ